MHETTWIDATMALQSLGIFVFWDLLNDFTSFCCSNHIVFSRPFCGPLKGGIQPTGRTARFVVIGKDGGGGGAGWHGKVYTLV